MCKIMNVLNFIKCIKVIAELFVGIRIICHIYFWCKNIMFVWQVSLQTTNNNIILENVENCS